jgi:hypothetical protein
MFTVQYKYDSVYAAYFLAWKEWRVMTLFDFPGTDGPNTVESCSTKWLSSGLNLSNDPVHSPDLRDVIAIVYLPLDTNSLLQPVDQEATSTFMAY